jgi:type III restriction enzyme
VSYKIDKLIINKPYEKPSQYWTQIPETHLFKLVNGRRQAGYIIASESDDPEAPGNFIPLPLVNQIREKIDQWRANKYPGVTPVTRRLLEYWNDEIRQTRLFFCQLEAIETIIWESEALPVYRKDIIIPTDGGPFRRLCCKMATGTGKTVVMAMLVAWQTLNSLTYPQDPRFTRAVLVIAPGLTIKSRLQVLLPSNQQNFYDQFDLIPPGFRERLRNVQIRITNWHTLNWENEEQVKKRRSVDKRGPKSDEAYVREVLGELSRYTRILVINDEAHHAWRTSPDAQVDKTEAEIATVWIEGLDRINRKRGIHTAYDFTATPMAPTGGSKNEVYQWVISDFNLNDAIESGLVKTPQVVVSDDSPTDKKLQTRLRHIYKDPEVEKSLNKRASENTPLPDLVTQAYALLGADWDKVRRLWESKGTPVPPVLITVTNRTETAARLKYAFDNGNILIKELCIPEKTLHIDSKVLQSAEAEEEPPELVSSEEEVDEKTQLTKVQRAELLRQQVDTIGVIGKPGEQIRHVISVGMLTEGWDAKTVTHIMGLRAFASQLLCEQVVGRGLRRTSYEVKDGYFEPEYVNIFGIPISFIPHEDQGTSGGVAPTPKTPIHPDPSKQQHEIAIPNVIRIEHTYKPTLTFNLPDIEQLKIDAYNTPTIADMAPVIDNYPDITKITTITLNEYLENERIQTIVFRTAKQLIEEMKPEWRGKETHLVAQLIDITERFINSDQIKIQPNDWNIDPMKRRVILQANTRKIIQHIINQVRLGNTESLKPIFDEDRPLIYTGDMPTWYTGRQTKAVSRSHINFAIYDSRWEATEAFELERNPNVESWVKNDHLGFEIHYIYGGAHYMYRPDFIIRLKNGTHLILEVKGDYNQQARSKEIALQEWIQAINTSGGFGKWANATSTNPRDIQDIIEKAMKI